MKAYFSTVKNLDEAKAEFRKLSLQLHPDTSGYDSQAEFVEMMKTFRRVTDNLKFKTGFEADKDFNVDAFYDIVKKFDDLTDIKISFVGSFIWLEDIERGAMYSQKALIKSIELANYNSARWANKKLSWYFSPQDYKQKGRSDKSLEELKEKYQTQEFKTRQTKKIA